MDDCTERKSSPKIWKVVTVLATSFMAGFLIFVVFSPIEKYSFTFWIGAALMAIPGWVALESLGAYGFNSKLVNRPSKAARICLGVIWVLLCLAIYAFAITIISSLVA
jgi:hypothetical protein